MPSIARQIASLAHFLQHRDERARDDAAAAHELRWVEARAGAGHGLPEGMELQWLGTSGFRLAYQGHALLIDPYVTRVPITDVLRRRPALPAAPAVERYLAEEVDAVLVGHTHFDHAIDVPLVSQRTGCAVYGSRSLANLMQLHGLRERAVEVAFYDVYEIGPFSVSFVPSVHSKLLLGWKVPSDHDVTCEHLDDLVPGAYGCGQVYGIHIEVGGVRFYHQGSADLLDDAIRHRGVDFFLMGIAGRGFTPAYAERILRRLEPRVIVPHHYDDFFRPLDEPMAFSLNVDLAGFVDEVRQVSGDFEIRTLEPLERVGRAGAGLRPGCAGS